LKTSHLGLCRDGGKNQVLQCTKNVLWSMTQNENIL
jgi:hypothetical protein